MKIAVNTRFLLPGKLEGIGWFTYETMRRISKLHPEHEFLFFFDRKFSKEFVFENNVTPIVIHPPARHPYLWHIWFHYMIPLYLKKHKVDLFVSTDGFLPLRTKVPCLTVIHDINFAHNPQDVPRLVGKYYNKYFPQYAHKATRIATVSKYSKQDICNTYNISKNKIDVVYNGANDIFQPIDKKEKLEIRNKYSNNSEYFLFIGALHPRKNVARLILAFYEYKTKTGSDKKLLIVGEAMFMTNDIKDALSKSEKHSKEVIFTGRLDTIELGLVMGSAFALTFVPYFEGFGIPVLEALRCHVPVICSNITSLPEVAGTAALYVDPFSIESISKAMIELDADEELQELLIERAEKQKLLFSWNQTAEKLWQSIVKSL